MKRTAFLLVLSSLTLVSFAQVKTKTNGLKLSNAITLPNVKGGFDLMAADIEGKRLLSVANQANW